MLIETQIQSCYSLLLLFIANLALRPSLLNKAPNFFVLVLFFLLEKLQIFFLLEKLQRYTKISKKNFFRID